MFRKLVMLHRTFESWIVMLWCGWKPNCSGRDLRKCRFLNQWESDFCCSLSIWFRREIGQWLFKIGRFFYCLGSITINACFQGCKKYSSRAQTLRISHRDMINFLSQCLKHKWLFGLILVDLCLGVTIFSYTFIFLSVWNTGIRFYGDGSCRVVKLFPRLRRRSSYAMMEFWIDLPCK